MKYSEMDQAKPKKVLGVQALKAGGDNGAKPFALFVPSLFKKWIPTPLKEILESDCTIRIFF
jgi:hypothetical protein